MSYDIVQDNVLDWCASYDGPPFHALLCDSPYHLTEITRRFGGGDAAPAQYGSDGAFQRVSRGFMGKAWDGGDVAFRSETWAALAQHLHPGAYGMAFASTRGYHRMACAIEDAGLIIHTMLGWAFGSGFPKATRIDVQIDRRAGAEREVIGQRKHAPKFNAKAQGYREKDNGFNSRERESFVVTAPATELAAAWEGHRYGGQALKPGFEPLVVFSKPFTANRYCAIICQMSVLLEGLVCILSSAHDAENLTNHLHQSLKAVVGNFAHQSADVWGLLERVCIAGDRSASSLAHATLRSFVAGPVPMPDAIVRLVSTIFECPMRDLSLRDTDISNEMGELLASIVSLWSAYSDALSNPPNTFTTAMEERLTTDLKISRLLIEQSIHAAIMPRSNQPGLSWYARRVALNLQNAIATLPLLSTTTAAGSATDPLADLETDQAGNPQRFDPIILFQRPYEGRPVDSITRTGAGALWVDGGRIGRTADDRFEYGVDGDERGNANNVYGAIGAAAYEPHSAGRWPSNLILTHDPACNGTCVEWCAVRRLGEQGGKSESTRAIRVDRNTKPGYDGGWGPLAVERGYNDSGTAARFFYNADWMYERLDEADPVRYVAKASTAEREMGLDGWEQTTVDDGRQTPIDNPYLRGETGRCNTHPTVKPISLTKYLATLLLPPSLYAPRRLLIPFAGSGSEMIGAGIAGWEHVQGVELEEEHVKIARSRLQWWIDVFPRQEAT